MLKNINIRCDISEPSERKSDRAGSYVVRSNVTTALDIFGVTPII